MPKQATKKKNLRRSSMADLHLWLVPFTFERPGTKQRESFQMVVEAVSRFCGPDAERDNAAGTRFCQALESLVEPSGGATILGCHHVNKTSRGTGATVDASGPMGFGALRRAHPGSSDRERVDVHHRQDELREESASPRTPVHRR